MLSRIPAVTCAVILAPVAAFADPPTVDDVTVVIGPPESPLRSPFGIDFDDDGTMFIVELEGGRVHERTRSGEVRVIAGDGSKGKSGDGGPAKDATFNGMHNLAVTKAGKMYIADSFNDLIRVIDLPTRTITTLPGQFDDPMCVSLDPAEENLYVADLKNRRVVAIELKSNTVRLVAGNGDRGVPEDGRPAAESPLVDPRAVAVDGGGRVYILERGGHALRVVETDGTIRTVAGTGKKGYRDGPALEAAFDGPKHLCVDAKNRVLIADDPNAAVRCYDPATGTVTTVLGRGQGDEAVKLNRPHGVCIEHGVLYVADSGNDRILRVSVSD